MEKEFNLDELKAQMKTKSNDELLAEINEMLECMTDRGTLEYHRCFIEAWFSRYYPATYQMYLARQDKEKQDMGYKSEVIKQINSIDNEILFRKIYSFIKGLLA